MASWAGRRLRQCVADLHVHTVLSPCAASEMIPPLIVQEALAQGIHLIAITDHNASANVRAVQKAAAGTDLIVIPAMELQTYEEVHLLCLFDAVEELEAWQEVVDAHMPPVENKPELFGEQYIVNETGCLVRRETRLLVTSTSMRFKDAVIEVARRKGLVIPAHVDRPVFSLFANLGFLPPNVAVDALEISPHIDVCTARSRYPGLADYPVIQSGDVHHLDEFMGTTLFHLAAPSISEIRLAFQARKGRSCTILSL
jgi:PHP family Zn ribbon phosphoesterase